MIDARCLEAFVHAPGGHTILGRKLHPLCALDLLSLEAVNSPVLLDGGKISPADLILAVWIFSNDYPLDCTIESLEPPVEWVKSLVATIDMARDCVALKKHFDDHFALPEVMRDIAGKPMTPRGTPWMMSHVLAIVRHLHVTLYDAWTMSFGQLAWYSCAIEEMDDPEVRIIGPELREQMEAAKNAKVMYTKGADESDSDFAKRVGITVDMLHAMQRKNP